MEKIIDLSIYEINKNEFDKISTTKKKNIKENMIGFIFTNKINELYNLDENKNKWIIKYDNLLFILDFIPYIKNNETIQIIRIHSSNFSNSKKIYDLLKFKEVNKNFI